MIVLYKMELKIVVELSTDYLFLNKRLTAKKTMLAIIMTGPTAKADKLKRSAK